MNKPQTNNVFLSAIVCLIAVQLAVLVSAVLGLFAAPGDSSAYLPEWATHLKFKWDLGLFWLFAAAAAAGHAVAKRFLREKLRQPNWWRGTLPYLTAEAVLTFLLISAAYKMTIYDNSPLLAQRALIALGLAAFAVKVAWRELCLILGKLQLWAGRLAGRSWFPAATYAFSLTVIAAVIYVPDLEAVLAEMFIGEQLHHFDFFFMTPGWAALNGKLPYIGVMSQYGVGIPQLLPRLAEFFGGFDYLPVLRMGVLLVIAYYFFMYGFVRTWLHSGILALAAFLLVFRLQMLHYGVSPLCWIYPSTTPLRFALDIVWLWLLLGHLRTGRLRFLWPAALYSGFAVYYMTSTGACVLATFFFYLAALLIVPHLRRQYFPGRRWIMAAACAAAALLTGFMFFWATLGAHAWGKTFWQNMVEYLLFFAHGHGGGVLPIYESLKYRNFWASIMGFVLPLAYLGTAFFVGGLVYLNKIRREHLIVVVIAVYGLINYQYYVVRSAMTSYYENALPFVLVCCFWLALAIKRLRPAAARRLSILCLAASIYALVTNHNYISYPNMFNFSRSPMVDRTVAQHFPDRQGYFNHQVKGIKEQDKLPVNSLGETGEDIRTEDSFASDRELKEYFRREFDFSQDAALIKSLTAEGQEVALLSSFETKILMQAGRPPFFYHVPLIASHPMRMRAWPGDSAHSPNFLKDTLRQLEVSRPPYIFVEKVFIQDKIPESYAQSNPNIFALVNYIRSHYTPAAQGRYLAAMKRK